MISLMLYILAATIIMSMLVLLITDDERFSKCFLIGSIWMWATTAVAIFSDDIGKVVGM